ncbi:MAG: maltose alpha-D-glucosyltransferase [Planctomycetota bacterium]
MIDDPLWYKDAIIYEVHVRAFFDGNNDGVGDFEGLTQKLEYLVDLGVNTIWLLPFMPSPLRDDGYDIADYTGVNPRYGTLEDVRKLLDKAHALGLRVITELVINHTSDQHAWFQCARRAAPGSPERNFYVWSDTADKYADVPLMFPDFETSNWSWDPLAKQYYWHRFYSHQPDLNFDNPAVWEALLPVVDFWFELGVDGMRLDAVPYLFEREGTSCEHLPETHAFLKALRKHVDERYPNRLFLAEANAWPDDMVKYFGDGDECQMAFHFPLMPRLFMALHQEDRFPITDILSQTPAIPDTCQWGLFLRNHDELTLAMITDEERDAMYSAYTQDRQARLFLGIRHRLAPLLRNDKRRIQLLNALLFSLPGSPVIYYGDEIGMGDNIYLGDRNGVRTPMQWSDDRNAGFSRANSQKLFLPVIIDSEYHYEAVNVETQQNNPSSLLWWTKRLIALRKQHPAFGRGDLHVLEPDNSKVLAFVRQTDSEKLLIVVNLSRFVQHVSMDLRQYGGLVPEEIFGRTPFPKIGDTPYSLTLGPYGFYWFTLNAEKSQSVQPEGLPKLALQKWSDLARESGRDMLTAFLSNRHLPGEQARVTACRLLDFKPIPLEGIDAQLLTYRVEFSSGVSETLFQPLAYVPEDRFNAADSVPSQVAIARTGSPRNAILCDPIALPEYANAILAAIAAHKVIPMANGGQLACIPFESFNPTELGSDEPLSLTVYQGVQHHVTVVIGRRLVLRAFRRADEGQNPDVEIGRYLQQQGFAEFAQIAGVIEYRRPGAEPITLDALHHYVPNQGDAWQLMLDQSIRFFDGVAAQSDINPGEPIPLPAERTGIVGPFERWEQLVSPFTHSARSLAAFTARLHLTLDSSTAPPAIISIPYTAAYQRSFYQSLRNLAGRIHTLLIEPDPQWSESVRDLASQVRSQGHAILARIHGALDPDLAAGRRIRCHGDYHLGQLLLTGRDFVLSDFEGAVDRPIGERRIKRSPLHDVAALIRSFDYVASSVRLDLSGNRGTTQGIVRPEDRAKLEGYARAWLSRLEYEFFKVYTEAVESAELLPKSDAARHNLLELSLLERALRETEYDLTTRPDWAVIPLSAILRLIDRPEVPNT